MPRIHVVGESSAFSSEARVFYDRGFSWEYVNDPSAADLVILTGGADINPRLYHEKPHASVYGVKPVRDFVEIRAVQQSTNPGRIILGICRGGQLLNVLAGGSLWQDADGHLNGHMMTVKSDGRGIFTTSIHHQQMRPTPEAEILAVSALSKVKKAENVFWTRHGDAINAPPWTYEDVEVCWYGKEKRYLCVQGHPEYKTGEDLADWTYDLYCAYKETA